MLTNSCPSVHSVILGSFSNYLVTKSSAPVMVARKRLRKSKYKTKMQQQVKSHTQTPSNSYLAVRRRQTEVTTVLRRLQ